MANIDPHHEYQTHPLKGRWGVTEKMLTAGREYCSSNNKWPYELFNDSGFDAYILQQYNINPGSGFHDAPEFETYKLRVLSLLHELYFE